jgi:hypothetical protein
MAWDDAMRLPGSEQMGIAKAFIESLPWPELAPMPGSATWSGGADALAPQVCGIGERLRVAYMLESRAVVLRRLTAGATYHVTAFDPVTGTRTKLSDAEVSPAGELRSEPPAHGHDWVLLIEQ